MRISVPASDISRTAVSSMVWLPEPDGIDQWYCSLCTEPALAYLYGHLIVFQAEEELLANQLQLICDLDFPALQPLAAQADQLAHEGDEAVMARPARHMKLLVPGVPTMIKSDAEKKSFSPPSIFTPADSHLSLLAISLR